ncbi:MAG TPA: ABC transporter transmembrane domain-containing protein [Beijerinckiaceae bacterium]|jgi:ATP-binding cassette subfamily B protein|nr:ABC transporter transmembrane domain-containing protein [Beijerinckiaceae bacterium]
MSTIAEGESAPLAEGQGAPAKPKRPPLGALKAILPYASRYKGRIALAIVALVVAAGATLALPLAVRRVIDLGFDADNAAFVNEYFVALIAVAGVLALASASRYYLVITLGERIVADVRTEVFTHLTGLEPAFFDANYSGEIISRLTADTTQIKSAFGASASVLLRNLVLFVGSAGLMVYTSPRLSGFVSLAIPLIVLPLVFSGRAVRARSRVAQDRLADTAAYAAEQIGAVRTLQAYGAERMTIERFGAAVEDAFAAARDSTKARAFLTAVAIFLVLASVVVVLWIGAQDVMAARMSAGTLSQFVLYAVLAGSALGQLSEVWAELAAAAGAAERLAGILHTPAAIAAPQAPQALPSPPHGRLAFERVSFAYATNTETSALADLSFSVAPGERVAIVGPSGAGKSTIFQLILRFYDPGSGRVLIDGVDLARTDPVEARKRVALVSQDPVVFGASVADNLRYGAPQASEAQLRRAAKLAAADGFIREMPGGYDEVLGERGVTLSGGQRQRLAIARAILKDAPILLLDEATSALDAESEALVQGALDTLMQGRTTLVVAHRLATVLGADRILVLDRGRIVEEGKHADLVARNGLYARLARLQFDVGASTEIVRSEE